MARQYGATHIAFLSGFGLLGWGALIAMTAWPLPSLLPLEISPEWLGSLMLVGMSRLLSFRVYGRARIALDSAFYVAARFVFGTVAASWLLIIVLTFDGLVRVGRGRGPVPQGEAPPRHTVATLLHLGGSPSLVLLTTGILLFDGDISIHTVGDVELFWQVPLFAVIFLSAHYYLAGGNAWFLGTTSQSLLREFFLRSLTAELALVPLSLAMVLAYKHQGMGLFLILGSTGLLYGGIFRRLSVVSESLEDRVNELQAINRIGRIISNSYDQETLFQNLAVASLQLVGQGSLFLIGLTDETRKTVHYQLYDAQGVARQSVTANVHDGLSGWVMRERQALCLGDLQKQYLEYSHDGQYNDERYHSWLGVPLVVYGEVVGVMSVQSERRHAYSEGQQRVLATIADQAAVAIENSRLYQLATVDGLTGLFVRRYFDQRLLEEWHRTQRYGNSFCLGLLDLDNFKDLNDTYGHQTGDQVLREAARVVRENMRSFDVAARYGGEEFAFILPRTGISDGEKVAERIREDVERIRLQTSAGTVQVTVSIGLAQAQSDGNISVAELLAKADESLYRAKAAGRNRVMVSAPPQDDAPSVSEARTH